MSEKEFGYGDTESRCGMILASPKGQFNGGNPCAYILLSFDRDTRPTSSKADYIGWWTAATCYKSDIGMSGSPVSKLAPEEVEALGMIGSIVDLLPQTYPEWKEPKESKP